VERPLCRELRFGREGRERAWCGVTALRPWRACAGIWGSFAELGVEVQRQGGGPVRYIYKYMENNNESK
jgi:hypothetical protein